MKNIIVLVILLLMIIIPGCVDRSLTNEEKSIETVLLDLIDNDDVFGIDGFDSDGAMDLEYEVGLETDGSGRIFSDTLNHGQGYRVRFGKNILDRQRSVEFETGEDTAIGLVSHQISGEFIANVIDTSQVQLDSLSFTKDYSTLLTRKIRFIKVEDDSNPDGYRWKIDALTPMIGGAGDKVSISRLSLYIMGDSLQAGELLYSFTSNELGDLFIDRESLPSFTAFTRVVAHATVENTGPEYTNDSTGVGDWVFFNYGKNRQHRGRVHLRDSGGLLDETMNDNIHSGSIRIHGPGLEQLRRVFRSFTESIDLATMFVSDGGYNTSVWSIPYTVERP